MTETEIIMEDKNKTKNRKKVSLRKPVKEKMAITEDEDPLVLQLRTDANRIIESLSRVTKIDQMMLGLNKYSGTLGDYSMFNSILIYYQYENATIVRSIREWRYFGRRPKEGTVSIKVLYPLRVPKYDMPGRMKAFTEKKKKEGVDDNTIFQLVHDKFYQHNYHRKPSKFGVGNVYDISQTEAIPGKEKPVEDDRSARSIYKILKEIAKQYYDVKENTIFNGARGYTAHSRDEHKASIENGKVKIGPAIERQTIVVMKVPGEDVDSLHTLIHEMSHARLDHLSKKGILRGIAETEAELSSYLVGSHFGFDFRDESAAYIKGWLDDSEIIGVGPSSGWLDNSIKKSGEVWDKSNLYDVMNNAKWLIDAISNGMQLL